jgi:hypothetical protein
MKTTVGEIRRIIREVVEDAGSAYTIRVDSSSRSIAKACFELKSVTLTLHQDGSLATQATGVDRAGTQRNIEFADEAAARLFDDQAPGHGITVETDWSEWP